MHGIISEQHFDEVASYKKILFNAQKISKEVIIKIIKDFKKIEPLLKKMT